MLTQQPSRRAILAFGIFLIFAAVAASYAGVTLLLPGTFLDRAWALNPHAHQQLASFGRIIGIPFLLLAAVLAQAAWGWFRRCLWAWRLAVLIIATQLFGDSINLLTGHLLEGFLGLLIASALLLYLFRPSVRSAFARI